jgi:hypothetical protein
MKYVGKQKALAFAVMAMFASGSAYAAVNLNNSDNAVNYAKELKFDDTNTATFKGSDLNLTGEVARNLATSTTYYFRFALSAGEWATTSVAPSITTATGVATPVDDVGFTTSNYGASKKTLIVPVSVGTVAVASANAVNLDFGTNTIVSSSSTNPISGTVEVEMSIHSTEIDASNNTNALPLEKTAKTNYIAFTSSVYSTDETDWSTAVRTVDVVQGSKFFTAAHDGTTASAKTVALCEFAIGESAARLKDGSAANSTATVEASAAGSVIKVKGNFDALVDGSDFTTTTAKGRLFFTTETTSTTAGCSNGKEVTSTTSGYLPATTLSATEATFTLNNSTLGALVDTATPGTGTTKATLCMTANGTTPIVDGSFTVTYEPVAAAGFQVENTALTKCAKLAKNGSTFKVPMVLDSTSAYRQFIRVTNPSSVEGAVHIKAYNDDGTEGTQTMDFTLKPGQSSGMISMSDLATATGVTLLSAANGTAGTAANKFRLTVEAEFGSGANGQNADGVIVRSYAQTKDRNGFSEFQ